MRKLAIFALGVMLSAALTMMAQELGPCDAPKQIEARRLIRRAMHFEQSPPLELEEISGGRSIISNNYQEPLTAVVLDIGALPKDERMEVVQDALIRMGLRAPIPRGLSFVGNLPSFRQKGQVAPEPRKIVAALWADGSSFGPPESLSKITAIRTQSIRLHDDVIALLQKCVSDKCTQQQLLDRIEAKNKSGEPSTLNTIGPRAPSLIYGLVSTIRANAVHEDREALDRLVVHLIEIYQNERDALERGLPTDSNTVN